MSRNSSSLETKIKALKAESYSTLSTYTYAVPSEREDCWKGQLSQHQADSVPMVGDGCFLNVGRQVCLYPSDRKICVWNCNLVRSDLMLVLVLSFDDVYVPQVSACIWTYLATAGVHGSSRLYLVRQKSCRVCRVTREFLPRLTIPPPTAGIRPGIILAIKPSLCQAKFRVVEPMLTPIVPRLCSRCDFLERLVGRPSSSVTPVWSGSGRIMLGGTESALLACRFHSVVLFLAFDRMRKRKSDVCLFSSPAHRWTEAVHHLPSPEHLTVRNQTSILLLPCLRGLLMYQYTNSSTIGRYYLNVRKYHLVK
jgi:hypothetical protein